MPRVPLSVAIVCKNSIATIGRTLDSVQAIAEEVVAVDSGSTDGTLELLRERGVRVIESDWLGYIKTKELAVGYCTQPWVLVADSDESLDEALQADIRRVIEADDPAVAGYWMNRRVWYLGRFLKHAWQPEWRLRLVRRDRLRCAGEDPHDHLEIAGEGPRGTRKLAGFMRHDSFATMADHLAKQVGHARTGAQSKLRAGHRGSYTRLVMSPAGAIFRQMVLKSAWRDGWRGWLAAGSTAVGTCMKHMILIELSRSSAERGARNGCEKG